MAESKRWLIRQDLYELEVHDLCFLYEKYDFNAWQYEVAEELIWKMHDYLCAKDFVSKRYTSSWTGKDDGQLIFYNNSSYLLVDAETMKEALDVFWKLHKEFYEKLKNEEVQNGSTEDNL